MSYQSEEWLRRKRRNMARAIRFPVKDYPIEGMSITQLAAREAVQKVQESTMARMSKDRVKFRLPSHYWEKAGFKTLLTEAFNINEDQQHILYRSAVDSARQYAEVVCRPSQFARFLILRQDTPGFQNMFKELHAELFTPLVVDAPVDISTNPAPYARD